MTTLAGQSRYTLMQRMGFGMVGQCWKLTLNSNIWALLCKVIQRKSSKIQPFIMKVIIISLSYQNRMYCKKYAHGSHVPWCMSGSLNRGGGGKRSRHSWCMRNSQFCISGKRPIGMHDVTIIRPSKHKSSVYSLKTDSHYDRKFNCGFTDGHEGNWQCCHWQQSRYHDNSWFPVLYVTHFLIPILLAYGYIVMWWWWLKWHHTSVRNHWKPKCLSNDLFRLTEKINKAPN